MAHSFKSSSVSGYGWKSMFAALSNRNYRLFWSGILSSYFGGQMQMPAQSWLAYELTHSPLKLTLVMAMQAAPMLLISLYSGVVVDRIQKRNIIIITQSFSTLVMITIAVLITIGQIQYWHLLVASLLNGITVAFNMPARNAILAELVPREKLYNAIGLINGGACVAQIAGPALSGTIIGFVSIQGAYFVGIAFNIAAIIILSFLPATSKIRSTAGQSLRKNLVEGLNYLRLHNILIIILIMEMALTLFGMSYQGLMPVFAELLNQQSQGYGFLLSAIGIGSLVGSLIVAGLGNFKRKGLVLLSTGLLFGLVLVLFASSSWIRDILDIGSSTFYLASFWLIIIGISSTAYTSTSNAIVQMYASDEFRGRMNSLYGMVIGLYPLSTLALGAAAEVLGAPLALTLSATVLTLFMLLMLLLNKRMRKVE